MSKTDSLDQAFARGFRGRCPVCGEGALFDGWLTYAQRCEACGQDFSIEDTGDGPAVFVIFAAGFTVVPLAVIFQLALNAPVWLTLLIWAPILVLVSLLMLRPFRGAMLAQQIKHKAEEARLEEKGGD